jgi:diguanylate cyclase (GGDEF)-like protein
MSLTLLTTLAVSTSVSSVFALIQTFRVNQLQKKIRLLEVDAAFGLFTRAALQLKIDKRDDKYFNIICLDLDKIKELNTLYGYTTVNEKVQRSFQALKEKFPDVVVARWFSGDELVIVFPNVNAKQKYKVYKFITVALELEGILFTGCKGSTTKKEFKADVEQAFKQISTFKKIRDLAPVN